MKSVVSTALGLVGFAFALPAPEVIRVLPTNWQYNISSLKGPGCPDFGADTQTAYATRLTYGQNTMDGSEIYYWFVAYPYLRVNLDEEDHVWCETELSYIEFKDLDGKIKGDDYKLRLHKNGTRVIATYDLDEGVKATFKFTYDTGDDEIIDTVVWKGPLASGQYQKEDSSPNPQSPEMYKLPKCGEGKIKFRTDLYISGREGKFGYVASETTNGQYYGIQQGFSYDWEKCKDVS
ncbi:hypothetical protein EK21DRAFT_100259 [Setomelanomma holmii]|uniref:Uncharacterized protein n=1 Tax=Setomelanomma holmii TaxID=210430 RepID=A0A9P4HBY1_9PLEO|nr:hypothetical protein EK21DRAFT_100259 [Setomelanomma holmii]